MRWGISRIPDQLLEEVSINHVLFSRALLHFEHQLGVGEGKAPTFDFFGLDSACSVSIANAARFGHQVDGDVVVDPDDDPRRAVVVAQFAEGTVGEDFQRA